MYMQKTLYALGMVVVLASLAGVGGWVVAPALATAESPLAQVAAVTVDKIAAPANGDLSSERQLQAAKQTMKLAQEAVQALEEKLLKDVIDQRRALMELEANIQSVQECRDAETNDLRRALEQESPASRAERMALERQIQKVTDQAVQARQASNGRLVDILEELLRVTLVEEHRTEAFRAKEVVQARERAIESLFQKARGATQN